MDWTLVRNLLQTLPLLFAQISFEGYRTFDPVHKTLTSEIVISELNDGTPNYDKGSERN